MIRNIPLLCLALFQLFYFNIQNGDANETMLPNNIRGMALEKGGNIEFSPRDVEIIKQVYEASNVRREEPSGTPIVDRIVRWVVTAPKHEKLIFFQRHGQSAANVWEFFAFRRQKNQIPTEKKLSIKDPELSLEGRAQCKSEGEKWREIFRSVQELLSTQFGKRFCIDLFASSALTRCIQTEAITMESIAEFGCDYSDMQSTPIENNKPDLLLVPYLREHQDSIGEVGRPWVELNSSINDMKTGDRFPKDQQVDSSLIVDDWWLPNTKEEVLEYAEVYKTVPRKVRFQDMEDSSLVELETSPMKRFAKALSLVFPSCKYPDYMVKRRQVFDYLNSIKPDYATVPNEHHALVKARAHAVLDSLCAVENSQIVVLAAHKNVLGILTQNVSGPFGNAEIRPFTLNCEQDTLTAV